MMSSPGTGLQQRDRRTSTSSTPFTTTPLLLCASCRLGRFTEVNMGSLPTVELSPTPKGVVFSASFARSTSSFNMRFATC